MHMNGHTVEGGEPLEYRKRASHPNINPPQVFSTHLSRSYQPGKCATSAKFISTGPASLLCAPIHAPKPCLSTSLLQISRLSLPFCWSFNFLTASTFKKGYTINSSHPSVKPSCVASNDWTIIWCSISALFCPIREAAEWRADRPETWAQAQPH